MFVMCSDIRIGGMAVKPSAVRYKMSVGNYTDTCTVTLPLAPYVKSRDQGTEATPDTGMTHQRSCVFRYGDEVDVRLGYNNEVSSVFKGFVYRVNYREQLVIECEGYAFQLRDRWVNKSWQKTTAREILKDVVSGTWIKLSPAIDDVPLTNVTLKNVARLKVLEWLQRECACRVWMDDEYLYAGASSFVYPNPRYQGRSVKVRIGWNVVSADELKKVEREDVQINIVSKNPKGEVKRTKGEGRRYSSVKEVKVRQGLGEAYLKKAAEEMQAAEDWRGYEGSITLFGEPNVRKGDRIEITDERFPERSGNYFVEEVEGTFDEHGYRQKLKLRHYGGK